jgi:prepilin-type N-terminal cleavage/methylation domain-containing protein
MSKQELKQKGFTIIEVVLVLAIAALIFLMVFIALPALQRNQRDAARKDVLGKVTSAVTTYQSNNRGQQPASGTALQGYVDGTSAGSTKSDDGNYTASSSDTLVDNNYIVTIKNGGTGVGNADTNVVQVITGAKCNSGGNAAVAGSTRNAAVLVKMENGDAFFCQDV